jgi:hypothetical protein
MDFGDTVYATATVMTISALLFVPMDMVFGVDIGLVGRVIAVLIAALITGLIFAGKLAESKMVSIAKIMVLAAVLIMFLEIGVMSISNSLAAFKDSYLAANPGTTWTNAQWATLMNFHIYQTIFFYVVFMNAIGFVGVYVGSMLRKPKKT